MPLLADPLPRPTSLLLREAVRRHAAGERRRRFTPLIHVGRPGGCEQFVPAHVTSTDAALRADLMAALLARSPIATPLVWLTRPGDLITHDVDAAWLSAALTAWSEAGRDLVWVVVTRHGWWDPRSDLRREWQRIRS